MKFKVFFINLEDNPQPWLKAQNLFSLLPDDQKVISLDAAVGQEQVVASRQLDPVQISRDLPMTKAG